MLAVAGGVKPLQETRNIYSKEKRYHKTYKMEGYRVFTVWEHEYGASEKAKCPVHIQKVVREV